MQIEEFVKKMEVLLPTPETIGMTSDENLPLEVIEEIINSFRIEMRGENSPEHYNEIKRLFHQTTISNKDIGPIHFESAPMFEGDDIMIFAGIHDDLDVCLQIKTGKFIVMDRYSGEFENLAPDFSTLLEGLYCLAKLNLSFAFSSLFPGSDDLEWLKKSIDEHEYPVFYNLFAELGIGS